MTAQIWKFLWKTLFYDISLILSASYNLLIAISLFMAIYIFLYFIFRKFFKKYKMAKYFYVFWVIIRPITLICLLILVLYSHWK